MDLGHEFVQVVAGESPLEGGGGSLLVDLEGEEALFEFGERREVVRREYFSLHDREIDLDLIEPTGVDRSVDEDGVGPFGAEAFDRLLAPVSGTVVPDPEDAASRPVGLSGHDVTDETFHGSNPVLDFAAAEDLGAMDVPQQPDKSRRPPESTRARVW